MSEPARNRFALDLEDLERQLRGAAQPTRPGQVSDPLAELTRIVGQDDPLKDLFAQRPAGSGPQLVRQEPSFAPAGPVQSMPPQELRGALDEFEALLRRTDVARPSAVSGESQGAETQGPAGTNGAGMRAAQAHSGDAYAGETSAGGPEVEQYRPAMQRRDDGAPRDLDEMPASSAHAYEQRHSYDQAHSVDQAPDYADEDTPDVEPRRSRKGLWTAAALMAVGVIGVGAAMTFRSAAPTTGGKPPVITADQAPIKVEPANPGGAEIPNQNKQIYERAATPTPPAQTKVVTSEEQPVDVQQAARSLPARVVLPGPGAAATPDPLTQAPAAAPKVAASSEPLLTPVPPVPGLGEPRRVRTVAIRPDGTPAAAPVAAASPAVTGSAPARPLVVPPTEAPRPRQPEPPKVQERATAPATTPSPPVRLASAAPATPPAAAPVSPATAAIRSGVGDFTVQLAAPGSEAEARATFSALQRKYPDQLRGQSPIVRKTDLAGGKTVFRLRVGPYSREDATTMCNTLQSAGGQCFIARN